MATSRGGADTRRFMQQLPEQLMKRVLPGAARAGAKVIAEEAKHRLGGRRADTAGGGKVLIADSVKVRVRRKGDKIHARILLQGPGAYVGLWLERGTAPHIISVEDSAREGRSVNRINKLAREGSLVIGDTFVGAAVFHPGAKPHPFLNPALDIREDDARAAAQTYINARVSRRGIKDAVEPESDA